MAKKFVCDACQQELVNDRQSVLVEDVKTHAEEEHGMEMNESEIREAIVDT